MTQPAEAETFRVVYSVPRQREGWELSEEKKPESVVHDEAVELLKAILAWWASSTERNARVARNLAVRWDEQYPQMGVDPDVCVLCPAPPDGADLSSVRTWAPGHAAPVIAIEVVSDTNPRKDYVIAPDKYAASGTGELWVFDPLLRGPSSHGGPFPLQIWQRNEAGEMLRTYAGAGPARSGWLDAYLVVTNGGRHLRLSADAAGTQMWPTAADAERAEKEAERAEKEAALGRVAELEALLSKK